MTREQRFGAYNDEDLRDQVAGYGYFAWLAGDNAARFLAAGRDQEADEQLAIAKEYLDEVLALEAELFRRTAEGWETSRARAPKSLSETLFDDEPRQR